MAADVTIIMVSYNTCELTLRAIETLLDNAGPVSFRLVVWDNASMDGSPEAIARRFPEIELLCSDKNVGFAAANNAVAELADSEWLLLLNPDTETHRDAVANIMLFGEQNPAAGIVGGRTVYPDGTLNPHSCRNRITIWSLVCAATGLSRLFRRSSLFNPEEIGGWRRDSVREVDIVVGCFLLIRTRLWRALGGFRTRYFMYGEEADLCLRAAALGYRPKVTPDAQIMHLVGASTRKHEDKVVRVMAARTTLVRDHWHKSLVPLGLALLWLWGANRRLVVWLHARLTGNAEADRKWGAIWAQRGFWLAGY